MVTLENNGGNISVMNIKEVYTNVLLISIANNRNFGRLVKEAEKETKRHNWQHMQCLTIKRFLCIRFDSYLQK